MIGSRVGSAGRCYMTAYPELEIGLHRWDAEAWTVDLRFNDPESDGFDSSATSCQPGGSVRAVPSPCQPFTQFPLVLSA